MKAEDVFTHLSYDWNLIDQKVTWHGIRNTYRRKRQRHGVPTDIILYIKWKATPFDTATEHKVYLESTNPTKRINITEVPRGDLHRHIKMLRSNSDDDFGYLKSYGMVFAAEGRKYLTQATEMVEKIESIARDRSKLRAIMALTAQWPMRKQTVFVK
jgi:hypothetical protein